MFSVQFIIYNETNGLWCVVTRRGHDCKMILYVTSCCRAEASTTFRCTGPALYT